MGPSKSNTSVTHNHNHTLQLDDRTKHIRYSQHMRIFWWWRIQFSCRKYVTYVGLEKEPEYEVDFFGKDVVGILPHSNDPMVIRVKDNIQDVKQVLIDLGSSTNIMLYDSF